MNELKYLMKRAMRQAKCDGYTVKRLTNALDKWDHADKSKLAYNWHSEGVDGEDIMVFNLHGVPVTTLGEIMRSLPQQFYVEDFAPHATEYILHLWDQGKIESAYDAISFGVVIQAISNFMIESEDDIEAFQIAENHAEINPALMN